MSDNEKPRRIGRLAGRTALPLAAAILLAGCNSGITPTPKGAADRATVKVPSPVDLLLPREIRIHQFTGTRTFDEAGGVRGIDVRVEALDAYADPTKAFGDFRFEIYKYRPHSADSRGERLAVWEESVMDPERNLAHWDNIVRTYEFKLQWKEPIAVGKRFVLVAIFSSPFTERLFAQRIAVSGE